MSGKTKPRRVRRVWELANPVTVVLVKARQRTHAQKTKKPKGMTACLPSTN